MDLFGFILNLKNKNIGFRLRGDVAADMAWTKKVLPRGAPVFVHTCVRECVISEIKHPIQDLS